MTGRQTKTIQWTINLPMDFPSDWDDDMIEFHLNESNWCCSNLISELEKYDEKNGCICGICEAKSSREDWRCEMKKYYRQAIAFFLVWFCSGVTMYSYQVENKILGITFTLLSFLYWFIIDKDD